jgi:hypothetical protein
MKTITIRFVHRVKTHDHLIQKYTFFGWKYIKYSQSGGYGDSIDILYCKDTKEELLKEVLEYHYKADKRFVYVHEYPELKHY